MSASIDFARLASPIARIFTAMKSVTLLLSLGLVASCGGDTGGVGVGGTGVGASQMSVNIPASPPVVTPSINPPAAVPAIPVTVTGPITGFGSVIVNGVKFDDSIAAVSRDATQSSNGSLRLGMTVEIVGTKSADGLTGSASQIKIFSEIKGPTQVLVTGANALSVLGVNVRVDASTVIDGVANLAAIKSGDTVEAYGLRDPSTGEIIATRIEVEASSTQSSPVSVVLNGTVQSLNVGAKTFVLNGQSVSFSTATVSGSLVASSVVQVKGTVPSAGGVVNATLVTVQALAPNNEGQEVEFEGIVTDYVSSGSFKVASTVIDASSPLLSATQVAKIKNGARCSVEGKISLGILKASELSCESASTAATSYEVSGAITSFSSASNFTARNQVIDASAAVFSGGKLSDLALGKRVHVKGPVVNNVLKAVTLEFE